MIYGFSEPAHFVEHMEGGYFASLQTNEHI